MKAILVTLFCIGSFGAMQAQETAPYLDEKLSIHERSIDLISRLTVPEKISLLITTSPGIPRLDIPKYYHGNEALHGVVRPGRFTVFPQAIGMASMWNPSLQYDIATAISDEARARWNELEQGKKQQSLHSDLLTFWSPTVNMARDPRWGRTAETYGEDPFLSGTLGVQFVKGLQGDHPRYVKVVSTPKHFAVNNEEHNRFYCNPQVSERDLREYYLPAFEMCIKEGGAQSIMAAYNALNDVPCHVNPWLLTQVLRKEWGFEGYVVSDCGGPRNVVTAHKYVKNYDTAASLLIKAGLDLECGDYVYKDYLYEAYQNKMVSDAEIDSAAYHVIRARMKLGLFDNPNDNPYNQIKPSVVGCKEHKELALESARQSLVLLKNENDFLPLNSKKIKSIAVVGINAGSCEYGDYSGKPINQPVSILDGIRQRVGKDVEVNYAPWVSIKDGMQIIEKDGFPEGLTAKYYNNANFEGTPEVRHDKWINFEPANQAPDPFLPESPLSIVWEGELCPKVSGMYEFNFNADDNCQLSIDGEVLIDRMKGMGLQAMVAQKELTANKRYKVVAKYRDYKDYALGRLSWKVPSVEKKERCDLFGSSAEMVRKSDVVIAVMGTNQSIEREGKDRESIYLPEDQQIFLEEMHRLNPNIVVVLVTGSSLAVEWMEEHTPAILNAWYPGEQGGAAVAEVLFGDYNPAGRLPITYYKNLEDLPPFDDYNMAKGRTYRYFEGDVLYPFGYGMSYTTFDYSNINVEDKEDVLTISFDVKNSGNRTGDEVAQIYFKLPVDNAPLKELKGFERTTIKKGKIAHLSIDVPKSQLRSWDDERKVFFSPEGMYEIMVGSSSSDIRLRSSIVLPYSCDCDE